MIKTKSITLLLRSVICGFALLFSLQSFAVVVADTTGIPVEDDSDVDLLIKVDEWLANYDQIISSQEKTITNDELDDILMELKFIRREYNLMKSLKEQFETIEVDSFSLASLKSDFTLNHSLYELNTLVGTIDQRCGEDMSNYSDEEVTNQLTPHLEKEASTNWTLVVALIGFAIILGLIGLRVYTIQKSRKLKNQQVKEASDFNLSGFQDEFGSKENVAATDENDDDDEIIIKF